MPYTYQPLPPELAPFDPLVYQGPNSVAGQFVPTSRPDPYTSAGYNAGREFLLEQQRQQAQQQQAAPPQDSAANSLYDYAANKGADYAFDYASSQFSAPASTTATSVPSYANALSSGASSAPYMTSLGSGTASAAPLYSGTFSTGGATAAAVPTATESALGIGAAAPTVGTGTAAGTATFSSAAAAEAAGFTPVASSATGGVMATPAASYGSYLSAAAPYLGAAAGAYGLYDVATQHYEPVRGVAQGAISGAAIGSVIPVIGTAAGAVIGGIVGLAGSTAFQPQGGWKKETQRLQDLQKKGVYVPPEVIRSMPTKARKPSELIRKDLPDDYMGLDQSGGWVNNKFAKSRNVGDLRGEDIRGYSAFAKQDPDWYRKPMEEQLAIADQALAAGAVKEHHGTIDVDFSKFTSGGGPPRQPGSGAPQPQQTQQQNGAAPPSAILPKGARISPGVYSDGRGGTVLSTPNVIPRAARR